MKFAIASCLGLGLALAVVGCYSPDLGSAPFACGSAEPRCPDNYVCAANGSAMLCTNGGSIPDAPAGSCSDDSSLEPNNMISNAHLFSTLPVGGLKLAGLAICPAGDKDIYAVSPTAASQTLQAAIMFDTTQAILVVNVLNASGATIANSLPNGDGMAKAALVNVPFGGGPTYVQVSVSPTDTTHTTNGTYKLDLSLM